MTMFMRCPDVTARTSPPPAAANQRSEPKSPPPTRRSTTPKADKQRTNEIARMSKHVGLKEKRFSQDDTDDADSLGYPGKQHSPTSGSDAVDDESSLFRNVVTPSPEGNKTINDILGPPPASTFLVPNATTVEESSKINRDSSQRLPREEPLVTMSASKYHSDLHRDNHVTTRNPPFLHTVTAPKLSRRDKIGIFVGLKTFSYGKRLVVSRVAPNGKFGNSGVEVGDIVVSINGKSMVERPSSWEAFGTLRESSVQIYLFSNALSLHFF
jgi:hypothetical protein